MLICTLFPYLCNLKFRHGETRCKKTPFNTSLKISLEPALQKEMETFFATGAKRENRRFKNSILIQFKY